MVDTLADEKVISPYDELIAYEYLYATKGSSRGKMSKLLSEKSPLAVSGYLSAVACL